MACQLHFHMNLFQWFTPLCLSFLSGKLEIIIPVVEGFGRYVCDRFSYCKHQLMGIRIVFA